MTYTKSEKTLMIKILNDIMNGKTIIDLGDYPSVNCGLIEDLRKTGYIKATTIGVLSNGFHDEPNKFRVSITLRGQVVAKCNSFENIPLWAREHPSLGIVPIMDTCITTKWYGDSTWEDESWHNDTCASFASYDLIKGKVVKIWTDYRHTKGRECEGATQYSVHLYGCDKDGEPSGDFIEELLATDNRNDVYDFIKGIEDKQHAEKIRLAEMELEGKRPAKFYDMQASRKFQTNLYDAMDGNEPELDGEVGYTYFDGRCYITLHQADGGFHVDLLNIPACFDSLEPAERYMWDYWLKDEQVSVEADKEFTVTYSQTVNYTKTVTAKNADEAKKISREINPSAFDSCEDDNWTFVSAEL